MTLTGSGFLPASVVYFNNSPRVTTYVSSTKLTANILASDITSMQFVQIGVINPPPGGGGAGTSDFQIISANPNLNTASPTSLVAGTGASSITVNGGNFADGASVLWNGKARPTTFISSNQLSVQLTAADVGKAQIGHLAVSNPAPGGVSSALDFDITFPAQVRVVGLPAKDLVWDPFTRRIYASIPSSYGTKGNSVAVINPSSGAVEGYHFVGSEPGQLALSDDGSALYAGLDGSGAVQRVLLPGFVPDINVSLGSVQFGGLNTAQDLKVLPGDPKTFGVVTGGGCCGQGGGLEFFKDTTQLPNAIDSGISSIQFADSSTLYGYSNGTLTRVAVNANGGTVSHTWSGLLTCNGGIQFQSGLVYGPGGQAFNPQTGTIAGLYDLNCNSNNQVLPSSSVNRVFSLASGFNSVLALTSFDLSHFTPISDVNLSQFNGTGANLIRWGTSGLAFIYQTGCCGGTTPEIVLLQSPMVLPVSKTANPVPGDTSLAPASTTHGGGNLKLTVNGTNFVPGSTVTWNGVQRYAEYVSATKLTVYIPRSDLVTAGTASVVVTNPTPGGGIASALTFTIN